ncbi:creatine kinase B-type, partial [Neolamprologus brichardi]|uniref:creatine kinase B-type n=1 Tax=Neolamprologus brichardi TaxID=32507 RepID=UPI0003EC3F32
IEAYHEQKITSQTPESDLNCDNLKGGDDLDRSYAVRCEVSVVRGIEDFCFPTHCSRGERRRLLTLARQALQQLEQELAGRLLLLTDLSQEQQSELNLKAPTSFQLRIGVARDWPDARAVWVSENRSLLVWVNIDEHLRLVSMREDANVAEAFQCICISLQKGTWATNSPELYNISNMATFGFTEVALTQLVVDGVKLLTIMEKRLEGNLSIDELVPAQK